MRSRPRPTHRARITNRGTLMNSKITVTNYFGGCPKCGRSDGLYNVYKDHWFVCHTHKVRWTIGSNILSSWRHETQDEQRERWAVVDDYQDIEGEALPEGAWSRDPVARKRELEEHHCKVWAKDSEEDARDHMRAKNRERVTAVVVEALKGFAHERAESATLEVVVDDCVTITCTKEGISSDDEPPF
jgi:hypothetical protein